MTLYTAADLMRFRTFILENPEVKTGDAIKIYNLMKKGADEKLAKTILESASRKRTYYYQDLGKHLRLEMITSNFGVGLAYSREDAEKQPHMITLTVAFFSILFTW